MIYGYLRVSTDKQDVESQKIGVKRKASDLNLIISEWIIDDGVSGTTEPEKRQLGKLMRKLKSGDIIISSELSRLGRSLFMVMRILEFCMKNQIKVYTVKDNYELGNNIQSKVLAFAFSIAAEIERDMISKRTIEGLKRRKQEGIILGRPVGRISSKHKLDKYKDKIITLNNNNVSMRAIAKKCKVHRTTLRTFMQKNNIKPNKGIRPNYINEILEKYNNEIMLLIEEGNRYNDIYIKLKNKYSINFSIYQLKNHIINNNLLYDLLATTQDKIRIEKNGALIIQKD